MRLDHKKGELQRRLQRVRCLVDSKHAQRREACHRAFEVSRTRTDVCACLLLLHHSAGLSERNRVIESSLELHIIITYACLPHVGLAKGPSPSGPCVQACPILTSWGPASQASIHDPVCAVTLVL